MIIGIFIIISASCKIVIEEIPKSGCPPPAILSSSLVFYENTLYMFGGFGKKFSNELWSYDIFIDRWSNILSGSSIVPTARKSVILIGANKKIYLYGGETYTGLNGELWEYDIVSNFWELLRPTGDLPLPRSQPSYTSDMASILYLFGGTTNFGSDSALYKLDLDILKWTLIPTISPPNPRAGCGLAYNNEKIYVWGGNVDDTGLYMLDLSNNIWSLQESTNTPPKSRQGFPIFALNNILYIFVGFSYDMSRISKGCYKVDLATIAWSEIPCGTDRIVWAYAAGSSFLVLFGGASTTDTSNELMYGDFNNGINYYVVSKNWASPGPRIKPSLHMVRSSLWLFGGLHNGEFYNDCWKYDLINDQWTYIDPPSLVPSPRSHHGSTVLLGDTIAIFGGKNSGGYLNDMYFYNVLSNRWVQIFSNNVPTARASHCIAFEYPWMYIYGGNNDKGPLDDFWMYSFADQDFIEIVLKGFRPPALMNMQCNVGEDLNFYLFTGETNVYTPIGTVFYYIREKNTWNSIKYINELPLMYSDAKALFMNTGAILFGGRRSYQSASEIQYFNYSDFTVKAIGNLPISMSSHTGTQVGRSMYLYGGTQSIHNSLIPEQGISSFYKVTIDFMECGRGHYGENCTICEPGYYNEYLNSELCSPCDPGTFNPNYGAGYKSQCIPCLYGSFADEPGSSYCKLCSSDKLCPTGTSISKTNDVVYQTGSQPKAYDNKDSETATLNIILIISFILGVFPLAIFIFLTRKRSFILFLDIFKSLHPKKYYEEPYATPYGSFFSGIFFILSLLFILTSLTTYFLSNITESSALVPAMSVENLSFYTNLTSVIYLHNYYGNCTDTNNQCNMKLHLSSFGRFYGNANSMKCFRIENGCRLEFVCENCTFDKYVEMNITILGSLVYADTIEAACYAGSSIPGEYSSATSYVKAGAKKVFNGFKPSIFSFFMVPSVFYTDSGKWKNEQVGFHVTYTDLPVGGSEFYPDEISFFNALSFSIMWKMSPNLLVTKRMINSSLGLLLSGILGSVAGLLAAIGKAMSVSETSIGIVKKKINSKKQLRKLKSRRMLLALDENENKTEEEIKTPQTLDFIKIDFNYSS